MDQVVAFGVGGFPMLVGGRYRLVATIPDAAFQVLPWNAPSPADIAGSLEAAGFGDVVVVLPWENRPQDWPAEASVTGDAFVVRATGTWTGRDGLAAHLPLRGSDQAISVQQVWMHAAPPTPTPQPLSPPIAPTPGPAPTPAPQRPQPTPPAPRAVTPEPLPPPKAPKGIGTGAKVALGGGAIAAATLLVAHAPFRRSRTA